MRRTKMIAATVLIFLLAACGQRNSPASPVDVEMSMWAESEPLSIGETTLIVSLQDADGNPIDGATLQVHGNMDHEGMTPVDREVSESTNGEYPVLFEWTMGGGWIITVTAQLPDNGGEATGTFEFFVEAIASESIINQHADMNMDEDAETSMDMDNDE